MSAGRHPKTALAVLEAAVLTGQINALALSAVLCAALRKVAGASTELGGDGGVLLDPIGESIFAILDDTTSSISML